MPYPLAYGQGKQVVVCRFVWSNYARKFWIQKKWPGLLLPISWSAWILLKLVQVTLSLWIDFYFFRGGGVGFNQLKIFWGNQIAMSAYSEAESALIGHYSFCNDPARISFYSIFCVIWAPYPVLLFFLHCLWGHFWKMTDLYQNTMG